MFTPQQTSELRAARGRLNCVARWHGDDADAMAAAQEDVRQVMIRHLREQIADLEASGPRRWRLVGRGI